MANITYTVNQDSPETIAGFEQYSQEDKNLLSTFQVNSLFDSTKHTVELHILSLTDELLRSEYQYTNYKLLSNADSAGKSGASTLTIDPIQDSVAYGYPNGGVKLLYHFLTDLFTSDKTSKEFYIENISPDRTELRLQTLQLTSAEIVSYTAEIKKQLQELSYFNEFRLNFKDNDLLIGLNIDTVDLNSEKAVVVKLYEPLPTSYTIKSTLNIVSTVSDSVAYEVDSLIELEPVPTPTLRPANFNIEVADESVVPTGYFSYDELFSYPVNNTNNQVYSLFHEKGIEVSVDYTDYTDFVHFSSAQERLINFKYKLDLINSYSASMAMIASPSISGSAGTTGSLKYYEDLTTGVVSNFDHYERHLYYDSGSTSWPKSNTTKPYNNKPSNSAEAITWYVNQNGLALAHDQTNYNSLINSIPAYLREDDNNVNYLTFIHMIGQHFDNLWLYSKAVTDKYDGDNRLNRGISKDLVAEALKNFGVTLYTSNNSIQDLFSSFVGQAYQSGSEVINNYITGSLTGSNTPIQPTGYDDYQKEVYKRVYHNLPLLLKSKGTERGIRALINCFGIPSDILNIKLYGGRNVNESSFYGDYRYVTSSLDKIRLDNTGSIVSGETISQTVSISKRNSKYTDDLHAIEVGFSPTDNVDSYIISQSSTSFNIDQYLGDPRSLYEDTYEGLGDYAETILGDLTQYNLQDYIRLIKFFDNVIFKMVKDFIPARSVADTGVIIKPNLLNRNKAKSVELQTILIDYTGSIDTANISGSHGEAYLDRDSNYTTNNTANVQTANGLVANRETFERPKFNGELANSGISISDGELNTANSFKIPTYKTFIYTTHIVSSSGLECILFPKTLPSVKTRTADSQTGNTFFTGIETTTGYMVSSGSSTPAPVIFPASLYNNPADVGKYLAITASNTSIVGCTDSTQVLLAYCEIGKVVGPPTKVTPSKSYNLSQFFTIGDAQLQPDPNSAPEEIIVQILQSRSVLSIEKAGVAPKDIPVNPLGYPKPTTFTFSNFFPGDIVTVTLRDKYLGFGGIGTEDDGCLQTLQVEVVEEGACTLSQVPITNPNLDGQHRYIPNLVGQTSQYLALRGDNTNGTLTQTYVRAGNSLYTYSGTGVDSFFTGTEYNVGKTNNTKYTVKRFSLEEGTLLQTLFANRPATEDIRVTTVQYTQTGVADSYYEITATNPGTSCTEIIEVFPNITPGLVCEITDTVDPLTGQVQKKYNCISDQVTNN